MAWWLALAIGISGSQDPFDAGKPLSPEESRTRIQVPDDVQVDLVAAEPLIVDPVWICFDERGRLFVAEYRDYPIGNKDPSAPPLSRISVLIDDGGDGRMDRATVFADQLPWCQGVLRCHGGVIATVAHKVLFLKDTDGDDVADHREVLFDGLGRANPQLQPSSPCLSPLHDVFITNGLSGGKVFRPSEPSKIVDITHSDFQFNMRTGAFGPATGRGQFGNSIDDFGNRFTSSNRNPIMHEVLPASAMNRNPAAILPSGVHDAAPTGADSRVYPIVETNTTAYSHTGTHTAACGVLVYRGHGLPPDADGNVFVCDPTAHVVTRNRLVPEGCSFRSERILQSSAEKRDWLASTDKWFQPVSLANGPDGALYVVDMYRAVIEHPQYMPPGLAEKLDLRAGTDRGRIYRVRAKQAPRSYVPPSTSADLVKMLEDSSGWHRDTARRILVERNAADATGSLKKLVKESRSTAARAQALFALHALGALDEVTLGTAIASCSPELQEVAIRLAPASFARRHFDRAWITEGAARRLLASVLAWGTMDDEPVLADLTAICLDRPNDVYLMAGVASCLDRRSGRMLSRYLVPAMARVDELTADRLRWAGQLAEMSAASGDLKELRLLLAAISSIEISQVKSWRFAILAGLAQGLRRSPNAQLPKSLASLVASPPAVLADAVSVLKPLLADSLTSARDAAQPANLRIVATGLLASLEGADAAECLVTLLGTDSPRELQRAALDSIGRRGDVALIESLADQWDVIAPTLRGDVCRLLLQRPATTKTLLRTMADGSITAAAVGIEDRTLLLAHGDGEIRTLAEKLFGGSASADRTDVMKQYQSAASGHGEVQRGREVFMRVCANCHRIGDQGVAVGPDISDVRNKTPEQLLGDILDPNRVVEPRFASSSVLLKDGRLVTGLVMRESAESIVLAQSGGKEETVARAEIEEVKASDRSFMPEGIEKDVTIDQMRDLLAFLKSGR